MTLQRRDGVALWRQIAETLESDIKAQAFAPGKQLPTEAELAERFSVNRHTVRRGIAFLEQEGLLRVEQGRGTFVQERMVDYKLGKRTRFSENIEKQSRIPSGDLVRAITLSADESLARNLHLRKGASVVLIESVGKVDGRPISVAAHHFPAKRFPEMIEVYKKTRSITKALAHYGVEDYTRKETRITARLPTANECRLLELPRSQPVLVTESVNVDAEGRVVEYGWGRMAAERAQLVVQP
ncbi:phosphonate metabolism transcriptional regulator PhnF [Pelagibius marinus]|uniref:phosphonate metabolism transcriptional regulator PhnF n=1 Tax=Pelagibius marinus TaxID=2762760 RepID=UPI0018728390|nr:phosphonate metabolism transcriptional regulator PhnF [Pelagibius marinus]